MIKGTLWKSTSNYVGSMEKRFCVLVGTLILDFESSDDFSSGAPPKAEGEVIGVSVWKGKAWPRGAHTEGFVYVTRLGHTNYCAVPSKQHHEEWMVWMRTALDMALGVDGVGPPPAAGGVAISREALHRGVLEPPKPAESEVCMKSGVAFGLTQSRHHCTSCGRVFALEYCNRRVPLPHHGFEQAVRVCDSCLQAQQHLTHLRYVCCTLDAHLHEQRRTNRGVREAVVRRLRRVSTEEGQDQAPGSLCSSLKVGLDLLEKGELSEEEFSGLVKAEEGFQKDEAYNRVHAGCLAASSRLGDSTLAVVGLLHRGAAAAPSVEFRAVVLHLRMLAAKDLDSIDFFWPQVLHAFYLLVPTITAEGVFKAELLEDFILEMALRSTHLAVKLVWWLKGYVEDLASESAATPGKGATGKQAHLVRLAAEVEDIVLARAEEANSLMSSRRKRHRQSDIDDNKTKTGGCGCFCGSSAGNADGQSSADEGAPGAAEGKVATPAATEAVASTTPQSQEPPPNTACLASVPESQKEGGRNVPCCCCDRELRRDSDEASPYPFERRVLTTFVKPTPAQFSLVGDELLLLRALRAAAAEQLGLDYEAKTRYTSWVAPSAGHEEAEEGMERGKSEAMYFEEQLTFVQALVDIAERLRFVEPITARGEHLKRELRTLQGEDLAEAGQSIEDDENGRNSGTDADGGTGGVQGQGVVAKVGEIVSPGPSQSTVAEGKSRESRVKAEEVLAAADGQKSRGRGSSGDKTTTGLSSVEGKTSARGEEGLDTGKTSAVSRTGETRSPGQRRCRCQRGGGRSGSGGRRRTRGFLPVCQATDPICPIIRIPPEEGHVFKTKQRAPTLITCEIIVPQGQRRGLGDGEDDDSQRQDIEGNGDGDSDSLVPSSPIAAIQAITAEGGAKSGAAETLNDGNAIGENTASSEGGDSMTVTRSRSEPMQRAMSRQRSELMRGTPGTHGGMPSPLQLHQRRSSRGSDREEVEEIIGTQVEGQGSLGRSIDNRDGNSQRPGSGSIGGDGSGVPGNLLPPTLPNYRSSPPLLWNSPPLPRFRQRAHSDPPFASGTESGRGDDGPGAVWKRCSTPIQPSLESTEPTEVARGPLTGVKDDKRAAISEAMASETLAAARGDLRSCGRTNNRTLSLDSNVYPEVLSAVGLGFELATLFDGREKGMRPATAPAAAAGFGLSGEDNLGRLGESASPSQPDPEAGDSVGADGLFSPLAVVVDESADKGSREESGTGGDVRGKDLSPTRRGSANSRLSRAEQQDLVLPEPLVEERLTGDEQASEVADVMRRSHREHEMLRHSPLGKSGNGTSGNGGSSGQEDSNNSYSGRRSRFAQSDDAGSVVSGDSGADNTNPSGKSTEISTRGAAREHRPLDIEREVRQQGGVRNDPGSRAQSESSVVVEESLAVSQARALLMQGLISAEELDAVVRKDQAFTEAVEQHAFLDVQFCVSQAFGESWASKRARIKAASADGSEEGWDLVSIIVKSNDDMRQEVCALQLIGQCQRIFAEAQLDLFLQPYVIVSTGSSSGLVQCLTDAISVDALKKNPGFVNLRDHFERTYGEPNSKRFLKAQRNFVNSLAAYSLASYVLQIKDRHNGNILLDTEGRLIHIDFGFILGMAPGGNFALETCPFKLPTEYVDVLGGLESQAFMDLVVAFTCGFLTLQAHGGRLVKLLSMMTQKSPFPCFQGKDPPESIVKKLSERLMPHLDKSETVAFCLDLIRESYNNYGQRQFDYYQWLTNGIMA